MLELGGEESSRRAEAGTGLAGWQYLPRWTTGLRGNHTRRGAGGAGGAPPSHVSQESARTLPSLLSVLEKNGAPHWLCDLGPPASPLSLIASIHESNREFNQVMAVKQSLSFLSYKLCDLDGVSHVTSEPPLH